MLKVKRMGKSNAGRDPSRSPDIFNSYAKGLKRLPHIGETRLLARRIGNGEYRSKGHAVVRHLFSGARQILNKQTPVR